MKQEFTESLQVVSASDNRSIKLDKINNIDKDFGSAFPQYINGKPFNATFSHKGDSVTVHLLNAEDVLKLADVFSQFLTENGIDNWVERKDKSK